MTDSMLIIGGGVIGLSAARELTRCGVKRITVVDKSVCGAEASWAAAGMLGAQAEADGDDEFFRFCCASRDLYPEFAAELEDETGVDVELDRSGTLYLSFSEADSRILSERYEWQRAAGLEVEYLSADEVRKREPFVSPDVREGVLFPNDWQVENRKLLSALRRYAELNDIQVVEDTEIERLIVENGRVLGAESTNERFLADTTVLTTGAWTSLIKLGVADMPFKVEPVRGQMVVFQTAKKVFQHVLYSRRGYLVPRVDGRVLAGSTTEKAGFDKTLSDAAAAGLRAMASEIAPNTSGVPTVDHWSGLRPYAFDGLPILGGLEGIAGLTIATAHYRNGILLAPLTAEIVADNILRGTALPPAFSPDRFRLRSVGSVK
jgi:glycine oxidase